MAELKDNIDKVRAFHEVFGIAFEHAPIAELSEKDYMLRFNLMKEENEENEANEKVEIESKAK